MDSDGDFENFKDKHVIGIFSHCIISASNLLVKNIFKIPTTINFKSEINDFAYANDSHWRSPIPSTPLKQGHEHCFPPSNLPLPLPPPDPPIDGGVPSPLSQSMILRRGRERERNSAPNRSLAREECQCPECQRERERGGRSLLLLSPPSSGPHTST